MAVDPSIEFKTVDELNLDPWNPRLGRAEVAKGLSQQQVLDILKTWSLFELAQSMARHGFWPQEALLVVEEPIDGADAWVVVEGNRRLAAVKLLLASRDGSAPNASWKALAEATNPNVLKSLESLPCITAGDREDADAFLGFRHVTGIKEWHPAEKAEFISYLVLKRGMTYKEVADTIGSKGKVVGRNFVTYQILAQLECDGLEEEAAALEKRFSLLFLALRNHHVRAFIGLAEDLAPDTAVSPIPEEHADDVADLIGWMFGTSRRPKVVKESREVDRFAFALSDEKAVKYLRGSKHPQLDVAYRMAGGESADVVDLLETAAYNVEQALSVLQHHADEPQVVEVAKRLARDISQVAKTVPQAVAVLCPEEK